MQRKAVSKDLIWWKNSVFFHIRKFQVTKYVEVSPNIWHFWPPNVWRFLPTPKSILHTSKVSKNSAQFWHYLPRESIRSYRFRAPSHRATIHPNFRWQLQAQLSLVLLGLNGYRAEIPITPSLVSTDFLKWLTKLREILNI